MNLTRTMFPVENYDLSATLDSGQAFRWRQTDGAWTGVIHGRWVRLRAEPGAIVAETIGPAGDWLRHYLQLDVNLPHILSSFPQDDDALQTAVRACPGLRLLRQDPWECLDSFICSSTKQIVQIRQIIALLCARFGEPVQVPPEVEPAFSFPTYERIAAAAEPDLRQCKLGFRAPYLRGTAQMLAAGEIDLTRLPEMSLAQARAELCRFPGVGEKIADCALLFSCGHAEAFPVDVWIMRALRRQYFPRRKVSAARMRRFIGKHFGPYAGYAQQYLFHHIRIVEMAERLHGSCPGFMTQAKLRRMRAGRNWETGG